MEKTTKKTTTRAILKVFHFGVIAALFSGIEIELAYLAFMLFGMIPTACGYWAVALFALAMLAASAVIAAVYGCGFWIIRKARISK